MELESCCRHLNHIQKQLNEAQDSLHDSIQLRSQLEDDLTIARSKILDLEDELTKQRKEQRMLGKKYMELKEENYTIKTRQLRSHSTTPATPIPSQLTKSLWMILGQLFMDFIMETQMTLDAMRYQRHLRRIRSFLLESNQLEKCSKPLTTFIV
ncbi:16647_t:CDS:2 [Rhizophagus irregularis]|nr:16647_t:CDS:2 [Rhizophagus irregularis]